MFVIINIQKFFMQDLPLYYDLYPYRKKSDGPLIIVVKQKDKYRFLVSIILFYILQKIILKMMGVLRRSVDTAFQNPTLMAIVSLPPQKYTRSSCWCY
jgi:hypothetical protein